MIPAKIQLIPKDKTIFQTLLRRDNQGQGSKGVCSNYLLHCKAAFLINFTKKSQVSLLQSLDL